MRYLLAALLLAASSLAMAQPPSSGDGVLSLGGFTDEPQFLPVEEAYQLALEVTPQGQVRLYWQIADGYYLYRKR